MEDRHTVNEKRKEYARQVIRDYPDKIAPGIQEEILAQQVVLGMSPYEAHLAAGAFVFKVEADQSKWPKNSDPYKVMWAQLTKPDNSKIWMTFETDTQFPKKGITRFRVFFQQGKAVEIEELVNQGGVK